ncbi:hypothetical protein BJY04DRAFT_34132 [Aspergillus karnatakaensis]|uniref:uncharacterized protein n=1 Tax=Aspergillus karnatakaensis TaxID=1810916 RepID=UPI003CCDA87E
MGERAKRSLLRKLFEVSSGKAHGSLVFVWTLVQVERLGLRRSGPLRNGNLDQMHWFCCAWVWYGGTHLKRNSAQAQNAVGLTESLRNLKCDEVPVGLVLFQPFDPKDARFFTINPRVLHSCLKTLLKDTPIDKEAVDEHDLELSLEDLVPLSHAADLREAIGQSLQCRANLLYQ